MFHRSQLDKLFELIGQVQGSSDGVDSNVLGELKEEAHRLQALDQHLILGQHMHRHGSSQYVFLAPKAMPFDEEVFIENLQEEWEPQKDEELEYGTWDAVLILS